MTTSTPIRCELMARHRALDRERFDASNNHAPMVLVAMERLGADDDQLVAYFESLDRRRDVAPRASAVVIEGATWREHLGRWELAPDFMTFFARDVDERGRDVVLREALATLMAGVGAHAFHPLLRLGYALDVDDDDEVAASLGYWAAAFLPGPGVSQAAPRTPAALLEDVLTSAPLAAVEPRGHNIAVRMQLFFEHPAFAARAARVSLDADDPLGDIAPLAAEIFTRHHHFTTLHAVTSCHALRATLTFCDDVPGAVTSYLHALAAAVLTVTNAPPTPACPLPDDDTPWPHIARAALASANEHTVKLVDSCREEWRRSGDDAYRRIALREVRNPAPFT